MKQPSDKTVVRLLAEFEGKWTPEVQRPESLWPDVKIAKAANKCLPDYLNSRDALAPVLAKLNEDQWQRLSNKLWSDWESQLDGRIETIITGRNQSLERWLLTMHPAELARAVATVVKENRR